MDQHHALQLVYRRFADADPELTNGFAEHAPMGAEAMLTLRRRARGLVGRLDGHLFHGLIRTAHAVRTLERFDSPAPTVAIRRLRPDVLIPLW